MGAPPLEEVWRRIAELGRMLSEDEWKRPTEVGGWSVQDDLTHRSDIESMLLDRPRPEHVVPEGLSHVKNEIGARNEAFVDSRRRWAGADSLAEFVEVTEARLGSLRAPAGFCADSRTPMSPGTVRGHARSDDRAAWRSPPPRRRRIASSGTAPYVIGKKVNARTGPRWSSSSPGRWPAPSPSASRAGGPGCSMPPRRIRPSGSSSTEAYARLTCGRPDPAVAAGAVVCDSDEVIGRRVVQEFNVLL